jgi:methionyl-tRNA formyltransferase
MMPTGPVGIDGVRQRIVFFGSPEFALPSLEALARTDEIVAIVTQPDRPSGRGKQLTPPPVKEVALKWGFRVEQPLTMKDASLLSALTALKPDLFVVVAYGRILPPALLEIPTRGPWNLHASLLPKFRGAAPIQWAVINDERVTGVCVMRMEQGLDTGPIAARAETEIGRQETAGAVALRLATLGAELLVDTVARIGSGSVALSPQDHSLATVAPLLKKSDGFLDFNAPARAVAARTRGVDPWPGATALVGTSPLRLFGARLVDAAGDAGAVLGLGQDGLVVACGDGASVAFAELQFPGRRRMPAAALVSGHPIPPGTRLRSAV